MTPHLELLKIEFRECCVNHLVLRQIDAVFLNAQFGRVELDSYPSGQRRSLVEEYYASGDWASADTVRRFLKAIESVLLLSFLTDEQKDPLRSICNKTGFEVDRNGFTIHMTSKGVGHPVKNLIFAADGPKPEIVLSDSVSNIIEIVENAEYCLVYDRPVRMHGLLWTELVEWWKSAKNEDDLSDVKAGRKLYARLLKSLQSPAERLLWETYFREFYKSLGDRLPALVPQVYLHYDPYTIRQLQGKRRLKRQRMDFLLLLSNRTRVVVEVDGRHHYADGNIADPKRYSEMVEEDRNLQLAGYEVYRFGSYELRQPGGDRGVHDFFNRLFVRHEIGRDAG